VVKDRAKRNSFQVNATQIAATATKVGAAKGREILQKLMKSEHPSTSAASSSSGGNSWKVCLMITTAKGRTKVALTKTKAHTESKRCRVLMIKKNGINTTTGGKTR